LSQQHASTLPSIPSQREPQRPQQGVAFFDLDRTLLDINSARAWVRAEYKAGLISTGALLRALWWMSRYHLGWAALDAPLRAAIKSLEGHSELEMERRVERFFEREVKGRLRPEGLEAIKAHKARGEPCVLLTTSSIYLARLVSDHLGLEAPLASRFEVREGRFTGEPEGELCFGEGKLNAARAFVEAKGLSLTHSAFYTDAYADVPLLREVGSPFVVCPDRALAREAHAQGWPVLRWSSSRAR
jgi:HAD superfamily hydrolase (TIGR01490 family)